MEELNWYNINESTLFPELEHQLHYIKQNNRSFVKPVDIFDGYVFSEREKQQKTINEISEETMESFIKDVKKYIAIKIGPELEAVVWAVLQEQMSVDWYKRDTIKSKMKIAIALKMGKMVNNPKKEADEIVNYLVDKYIELSS